MEDTGKIKKKVAEPAATETPKRGDGLVEVEYTQESTRYPMTERMSPVVAKILEKSGKVIIKKQ